MERKIRIFKSFEEQEAFELKEMQTTTPLERFQRLYKMQQLSRLFHPVADMSRKIIIRHGRTQ